MARKKLPPRGPRLELANGVLAVAFTNTAGAKPDNAQQGIESYDDLLTWGQQTGLLQANAAERLRRRADDEPKAAATVVVRARRLRAALVRLFNAAILRKEMPADSLQVVNDVLPEALPNLRLVPGADGLTCGWAGDEEALDRVLWPVVHSAADLFLSPGGRNVRQCAAQGCLTYFVDRPGSRRKWCEKACGNRVRALEYYYRRGRAEREQKNRGTGLWRVRRPREKKT